jgi:Dehydratase family
MSDNRRSRLITEGPQRSPNRAMLRAVGFSDEDFHKPIVGVANAHSTITPCNAGLGACGQGAEAALYAAGAMPQTFGTITVSDGISMGTEGMKFSLVSREVIADSIETVVNAQRMDGVSTAARSSPATTTARILPSSAPSRPSASTAPGASTTTSCSRSSGAPAPAPARAVVCTPPTPCPRPSRPSA